MHFRMVCECVVVALGYVFLLYLLYLLAITAYNLFYPFFIATPINLRKAAGGNWAGRNACFIHFCVMPKSGFKMPAEGNSAFNNAERIAVNLKTRK